MMETNRGRTLSIAAVLFGILALSNLLKPLQLWGEGVGLVFFGRRLSGVANAIGGPLFGLFLMVYAWGIWRMRRFALPMAYVYAVYVILNIILFRVRTPAPPGEGTVLFGIIYALIGIGVSLGIAILLTIRRSALGAS